jgi:hypothetical protein
MPHQYSVLRLQHFLVDTVSRQRVSSSHTRILSIPPSRSKSRENVTVTYRLISECTPLIRLDFVAIHEIISSMLGEISKFQLEVLGDWCALHCQKVIHIQYMTGYT